MYKYLLPKSLCHVKVCRYAILTRAIEGVSFSDFVSYI